MPDFIDLIKDRMEKTHVNVRGLEDLVQKQFGEEARVSRSLISLYLRRKAVPTYEAGYQIAAALGLDTQNALNRLHQQRKVSLLDLEKDGFERFKDELEHRVK